MHEVSAAAEQVLHDAWQEPQVTLELSTNLPSAGVTHAPGAVPSMHLLAAQVKHPLVPAELQVAQLESQALQAPVGVAAKKKPVLHDRQLEAWLSSQVSQLVLQS